MKPEMKIEKAKIELLLRSPFFGALVLRRPIIITTAVPTACITADGEIHVSPVFIDTLKVQQVVFLLAHEAMHYALAHAARVGDRDRHRWNDACDAVINDILLAERVGEWIPGIISYPGSRIFTEEKLYDMFEDGHCQAPGGIGADLDYDSQAVDEATAAEQKTKAEIELIEAAKLAKGIGRLPSSIARIVEEITKPKPVRWHDLLRDAMRARVKDDYTWARPNRRLAHMGVYTPSPSYVPHMGTLAVLVDTSGSVSDDELSAFLGHIDDCIRTVTPERVEVIYFDAKVQGHETYLLGDYPIKLNPKGGGGTQLAPALDFTDTLDVDVAVVLTDGCIPDKGRAANREYPVIFVEE